MANTRKFWVFLLLVIFSNVAIVEKASSQIVINKVKQEDVPFDSANSNTPTTSMIFFDQNNSLQFKSLPVRNKNDCNSYTHLLYPKVEEINCTKTSANGLVKTEKTIVGYNQTGNTLWEKELTYKSGHRSIELWLININHQELILSDLEVFSVLTGETIKPPVVRNIEKEKRTIPKYQINYPAVYRSTKEDFIIFSPEKTENSNTSGVFSLDPSTGGKKLIIPFLKENGGIFYIEDLALSENDNLLFIASRLEKRAPSWVYFSVFDLKKKKFLKKEKFGQNCWCSGSKIIVGPNGNIGFSYRDDTNQKNVLAHYKVTGL